MSSSFLDLGRGLISGSIAAGRFAAASMMASAEVAARAVSHGVEAGARTVTESAERLGGGSSTWAELAADTAAAPLAGLAAFTEALGVEAFRTAAATRPGRAALDAVVGNVAGGSARPRRESVVVVASDSGATAIRGGFALAETALRLAFGDTRRLRRALADGLQQMELLADAGEMHDLLPVPAVDEELRERARRVAGRAPRRFLAALEEAPFAELLGAMRDDAENLGVFVVVYPQVAALVVTRVGRLVAAGALDVREVEAFLEGRRLAGTSAT